MSEADAIHAARTSPTLADIVLRRPEAAAQVAADMAREIIAEAEAIRDAA